MKIMNKTYGTNFTPEKMEALNKKPIINRLG